MIPSSRLLWLLLLPVGLAALSIIDERLLQAALAVDGVLIVVAAIDAFRARHASLEFRRELHPVMSVGRANPVRILVRNRRPRPLEVRVHDDLIEDASCPELPLEFALDGNAYLRSELYVSPSRRGRFELGDAWLRYPSPWGLWMRTQRVPSSGHVDVYPDVQSVKEYELSARQDRDAGGSRRTRLQGGHSEFESLREYTRDDEFRNIDWRATAKRQRLIVRQYELERNQNVVFAIDSGRLMSAKVGGLPLLDHSLNAVLLLTHVVTKAHDRAGLITFSDQVDVFLGPKSGRSVLRAFLRSSVEVQARFVESSYDELARRAVPLIKRRSLFIIFTQLQDEHAAEALVRMTRSLLPRHLPLVVLFRHQEIEALACPDPGGGTEALYAAGAAAEVLHERQKLIRQLERRGVVVLDVSPSELSPRLLQSYLSIKARNLL